MAQPYIGEIRMFAGNFAPDGWMLCEGQLLSIYDYEFLFQVISTIYGGDGNETFALPDLRGRIPIHQGNGSVLAEAGGVEEVTLTVQQLPVHSHALLASTADGTGSNPQNNVLAQTPAGITPYFEDAPSVNMAAGAIGPEGGGGPHTNLQPYLCVNFIISLYGLFPGSS